MIDSDSLRHMPPVLLTNLLAPDREALLDLLATLNDSDWHRPTACAGWTVHDVALHILGGDLGNLSRRRDGFQGLAPQPGESLVAFIDGFNDDWVQAARRISPRLLIDLLAWAGPPMFDYFASLDLHATGGPVSWAGSGPAPVWLDVAREYTERWHHQQHIRDAVGRPGQKERRFLHPALATFVHAVPVALREAGAAAGSAVHLRIVGEAGGDWSFVREGGVWRAFTGAAPEPAARVTISQDAAWRLFTKGITPDEAERRGRLEKDLVLARQVLGTVAIMG